MIHPNGIGGSMSGQEMCYGDEPIVNYLDGPYSMVEVRDRRAIGEIEPTDFVFRGIHSTNIRIRDELLSMPSLEEGLNMARIDFYRRQMGAPNKAIRVLNPEQYDLAKNKSAYVKTNEVGREGGAYLQKQDVILVRRDMEGEEFTDRLTTESKIIHELAHASNMFSTVGVKIERKKRFLRRPVVEVDPETLRVGFAAGAEYKGLPIEEGYAEYERGQYVSRVLGMPEGLHPEPFKDFKRVINKYAFSPKGIGGEDTPARFAQGAMAALILETFISYDPQVLSALRTARYSVGGLREVAYRMNNLAPGTYQAMREVDMSKSTDEIILASGEIYKAVRDSLENK